jgi:maleylpyruvate isomerase
VPSAIPHDLLAGVSAAHQRLGDLVSRMSDNVARRPSLLPGWTVGHLLTHLARNADSHTHMIDSAGCGEVAPQYPGGQAQRDHDIDAGADRPVVALAADVIAAQGRLEQAWDGLHVSTWRSGLGRTASLGPVTLADLVFLRRREVEVHSVDLGLADIGGPTWEDLSIDYIDAEWVWTLHRLEARVPDGVTLVLAPGDRPSRAFGRGTQTVVVTAPTLDTLRWLTGRGGDAAWPVLGGAWS